MPKYELPKFSTEELLAAFGSQVSPAGVIKAGREGFKEGADLASTIAETKGKKLKQQQEIAEIERKLAAQELLAKTVEGKPEMEKKKAALQPLAPKPQLTSPIQLFQKAQGPETAEGKPPLAPSREVMPMQPESPEYKKGMESIQAEESKRGLLATGVRAGLSPDKAIGALYESDELTRANAPQIMPFISSKTGERLTAMWDPKTRQITAGDRILDPSEWVRDYKPDIRTEPGTEELLRITSSGTTSPITGGRGPRKGQPVKNLSQLAAFEKQEAIRTKQDVQADPTVKLLSGDLTTLLTLNELIEKRPKGAVGLTRTQLTVFAGEKGRLTDDDIRRNSGSPAIADRLIRTYTDLVKGNLSEVDAQDFKIIVDLVGAKKAQELDGVLSDYTSAIGLDTPNSEEFVKRYISGGNWAKIKRNLEKPVNLTQEQSAQPTGLTPEKQARLAELRAKKAAGTLR